jgi:diphthine-ammonia ligase
MGIEKFAEAMELPLYRKITSGLTNQKGKNYEPIDGDDEVEDLYQLLKEVKVSLGNTCMHASATNVNVSLLGEGKCRSRCNRCNFLRLSTNSRRERVRDI